MQTPSPTQLPRPGSDRLLTFFTGAAAVLALGAAALRIFVPRFREGLDQVTLLYLALPVVLLMLRSADAFSIGKDGITWKRRVEQKLDEASQQLGRTREQIGATQERIAETQQQIHATQLVLAHGPGGRHSAGAGEPAGRMPQRRDAGREPRAMDGRDADAAAAAELHAVVAREREEGRDPEDPQKGHWGGERRRNGRILHATVTRVPQNREWFTVRLEVRSLDPERNPLTGRVRFHLHPSFHPAEVEVPVAGSVAILERVAWGAFTVGAEADGGETPLELDLAELDEAPAEFRVR
jgi:hypothetical protein